MHKLAVASALAAWLLVAAAPTSVLDAYRLAMASRKTPTTMVFEYTVTRSGPNRIVTEQHRVYWKDTGEERNDTIGVNGTPVVPATSQVVHRTIWPYDPNRFLVSADSYDATPAGATVIAGRKAYAFALTKSAPSDFILKALFVDAKTHLPLRETFAVAGEDCDGSGLIEFASAGGYWLPIFTSVACTETGSSITPAPVFKESIRFGNYRFPKVIPPDVFGATP